ncbi:MAG: aminoacyl-tRNA deacylase, partial [Clostridia bacterium]|nr:aminoacyl-tRNA deacylase [Clostridia bacterium]
GVEVAKLLHQDERHVFKTLVTTGKTGNHYVFMVPVAEELDLKKAANAVNEKSIEMLKSKDLLALTGYVHGGCSPIGMKKFFRTVIHETAKEFETIIFSAGRIGAQIEMSPKDLETVMSFDLKDLIK